MKVNLDKTNVLLIGKDNNEVENLLFKNVVTEVKILGITFSLDIKKWEELNYKEILSKIKRLLVWWKQRDLTIMGKIHLIKTYALSKLIYVASSLVVPKWLITEIHRICFDFIWNGKDRVKRVIMYQDYRRGGLRMMNFELFVKAQRVTWVKRLLYGERKMSWKTYFDFIFRSVGGRVIFHCNYDTKKILCRAPLFYLEMLHAWEDMEKCRFFEEGKINPIVFNNKDFLVRGKMFFNAELYQRDIFLLEHIFDKEDIRPITFFHSLCVNSVNIAYIWKICGIILNSGKYVGTSDKWYSVDLIDHNISLKILGKTIMLRDLCSRNVYEHFVTNLECTVQIRDGHQNFVFPEEIIGKIFKRPRMATLSRELREFQFKLLHGAIYTKEHLFRFGFVTDELCSFCSRSIESYEHLFWNCIKVHSLWMDVVKKFDLPELSNADWEKIHIGLEGNSPRIKGCNTILFIVKYSIYCARLKSVIPSIDEIKKRIQAYREDEMKMSAKGRNVGLDILKWEILNIV